MTQVANISLAGFVAFLATKNPDESFSYFDNSNCAFAQYLKSLGYDRAWVGGQEFFLDRQRHPMFKEGVYEEYAPAGPEYDFEDYFGKGDGKTLRDALAHGGRTFGKVHATLTRILSEDHTPAI